jgi:hypothetical protein
VFVNACRFTGSHGGISGAADALTGNAAGNSIATARQDPRERVLAKMAGMINSGEIDACTFCPERRIKAWDPVGAVI